MRKCAPALLVFCFLFPVSAQAGESRLEKDMDHIMAWFRGESLPVDFETPRPPENRDTVSEGRKIFGYRCAVCHGVEGDGRGLGSVTLKSKPRDFTAGTFKFRSTPPGYPPTDEDLFKTVSRGIHGTAMLPWLQLSTREKWAVVFYIKTFSDIFNDGELEMINVPKPKKTREEYVKLAGVTYRKGRCFDCHGDEGYGDGRNADRLRDDWYRPIRPRNFRGEILKRGLVLEDIFKTIATGLYGTPMESHIQKFTDDEIYALAYFIQSISPKPRKETMTEDEKMGLVIFYQAR